MVNEFAVYSEYSDQGADLQPGANVRKFTHIDSEQGDSIQLTPETGVINLKPGLYHITASAAAGLDGSGAQLVHNNDAYCQLSYANPSAQEEGPISVGSHSVPDMIPSLVDTFLRVKEGASIVLEFLLDQQDNQDSKVQPGQVENHTGLQVFSRISILKMEEAAA